MYLPLNEELLSPVPSRHDDLEVFSVLEQGSGVTNEDRLLVGDGLYGVFDGATSLSGKDRRYMGFTGGAMAAQIACDTFQSEEDALFEMAIEANRRLAIAQVSCGVDMEKRENIWSTSMAVVRLDGNQLEYCQTGDSLILLLYNDGSHTLLTPELDIDAETMKLWQAAGDDRSHTIYSLLGEQIRKVRLRMNRDYGVLNGEPEFFSFLRYGTLELSSVSDILLFTDGLYLPKREPSEPSDWDSFAGIYRENGVAGLRKHVRDLQASDPSLKNYPRFKLHDDIAAVSLHLNSAAL